ncbi:uncharacterized protein B0I36DRAFT_344229 [Microdochium trichocladiopsis]|uniref:RING-type E3 ubiquitin transferase n=1 Tax=Microdochium trichocladiopsis TaxID=1682393 RepID=A0A9P8YK48_9PEZI|nr:uncharacterized protein B0I36DRAFT_344229 [Microdochium trichocladiopsis]KAH7040494.1 hypothetical protein B0I36DRAFT_344229 [Microdochium trichocladiopsis]
MVASRKPPGLAAAWALFLISFLLMPFMASAASANTSSIATFPSEVEDYVMYLYLSIEQSHGSSTYQYYAAPLTPQVGLGDPNAWRIINVVGSVMPVNAFNYQTFDANHTVAFVSCDWPATSNATANNTNPADPALNSTTPEIILNTVMGKKPTAIVLYSLENPGCSLTGDNLSYTSIWTMAVVEQAKNAIRVSNATNGFVATITGKDMAPGGSGPNGGGGGGAQTAGGSGNSNVAMSILYSITGLITALFLVIITTGAVRAHRNPERYGPRAAVNGRARQSRAKGIARAVLETLPIVKFGDAKPTKSDPEMEIDTLPGDRQQALVTGNEASSSHTRPSTERRVDAQSAADSPNEPPSETAAVPGTATPADNNDNGQVGCSICTEDFKVGEDVRVLPCDHNFHPACIDPWLVNVSGTCPLW